MKLIVDMQVSSMINYEGEFLYKKNHVVKLIDFSIIDFKIVFPICFYE